MQTDLHPGLRNEDWAGEADRILRACVHCGFCTATCPTYQLLGDELDGPRGRIYLIKTMLETNAAGPRTQTHLDRCLTCRACETTCPSDVQYGRLLDIGREFLGQRVPRSAGPRLLRWLLRRTVPYPRRMRPIIRAAQLLRPLLPASLRARVPVRGPAQRAVTGGHARRVILLEGCVQQVTTPQVNAAARDILDRAGVEALRLEGEGCCGALSHHLGAAEEARRWMRGNVRALVPWLHRGVEAVVSTASGCGVTYKDYATLLSADPAAPDAGTLASQTVDLSEYLHAIDYRPPANLGQARRVAWHSPCTLQHGQKISGLVEQLLGRAGYELVPVREPHLCCGSAGTYSILQADLSRRLLERKIEALTAAGAELIATANVGCQLQLGSASPVPVRHWAELLVAESAS